LRRGPFARTAGVSKESLRRIYACGHLTGKHDEARCPRAIVRAFAEKAFRRPAVAGEVDQYLKFHTMARKQGDSFEEGVATVVLPSDERQERSLPAWSRAHRCAVLSLRLRPMVTAGMVGAAGGCGQCWYASAWVGSPGTLAGECF